MTRPDNTTADPLDALMAEPQDSLDALVAESEAPAPADSWDYVFSAGGSVRNAIPLPSRPAYDEFMATVENPKEFEDSMAASLYLSSVLKLDEGIAFDTREALGRHLFKEPVSPSQMVSRAMANDEMIDRAIQAWNMLAAAQRAEKEVPSWWKQRVNAAARGLANVGSGIVSSAKDAHIPAHVRRYMTEVSPEQYDAAGRQEQERLFQKSVDAYNANIERDAQVLWEISKDPAIAARSDDLMSKALDIGFETIPYITATTAATLAAGPYGGFRVGWMVGGNSSYRTALDDGVPEETARKIGMAVGLASGAIEAFGGRGADKLMSLATAKIKDRILRGAADLTIGSVTEALEEAGQEVAAIVGEEIYKDVDWDERVRRVLTAAAGGGLVGGVFKTGSAAVRGVTNLSSAAEQKQALRFLAAQGELTEQVVSEVEAMAKEATDAQAEQAGAEGAAPVAAGAKEAAPGAEEVQREIPETAPVAAEAVVAAEAAGAAEGKRAWEMIEVDPSELVSREQEQHRIEDMSGVPTEEFSPIISIIESDGSRTILDGHNRAALAKRRGDSIATVGVTRGEYSQLHEAGYDDMEIAYASLARAEEKSGYDISGFSSELDRQFPGSDIAKRGTEALNLLNEWADEAPRAAGAAEGVKPTQEQMDSLDEFIRGQHVGYNRDTGISMTYDLQTGRPEIVVGTKGLSRHEGQVAALHEIGHVETYPEGELHPEFWTKPGDEEVGKELEAWQWAIDAASRQGIAIPVSLVKAQSPSLGENVDRLHFPMLPSPSPSSAVQPPTVKDSLTVAPESEQAPTTIGQPTQAVGEVPAKEAGQPPDEGPERKVSRAAQRVQEEAIAKDLAESLGELPTYETMSMQDQARMAAQEIAADYENAKQMAYGKVAPPSGLRPASIYRAVAVKARTEGDVETLRNLAVVHPQISLELTAMGQAVKAADVGTLADPVKAMQDVQKAKEKAVAKRRKVKDIEKTKKEWAKEAKSEIHKKVTHRQSWTEFVEGLRC